MEKETKKSGAKEPLRNMVAQFPASVMEWLEAEAEGAGRSRVRHLERLVTTIYRADVARKRRAAETAEGMKKGGMVALLALNPVTVALAVVGATALLMAALGMGPEF